MRNPAVRGGASINAGSGLDNATCSKFAAPPQDPPADALCELRFERDVAHLHRLGPRAIGELLREIGARYQCRPWIERRLVQFARLDPEIVRALHGDRFPPRPLHLIAPCSPAN